MQRARLPCRSTAPFIGAVVGIIVLREPLTVAVVVAGLLMGFGVYLHLTEERQEPTEGRTEKSKRP